MHLNTLVLKISSNCWIKKTNKKNTFHHVGQHPSALYWPAASAQGRYLFQTSDNNPRGIQVCSTLRSRRRGSIHKLFYNYKSNIKRAIKHHSHLNWIGGLPVEKRANEGQQLSRRRTQITRALSVSHRFKPRGGQQTVPPRDGSLHHCLGSASTDLSLDRDENKPISLWA